jgi:hypothetical protein
VQLFSDPDMPDVVCIEHLTSALYLDNREDAGHYTQVTNYLGTAVRVKSNETQGPAVP